MKSLPKAAVAGMIAVFATVACLGVQAAGAATPPPANKTNEVTLEGKIATTIGDGAIRAVTLTTNAGKVYELALDDRGERIGTDLNGKTITAKGALRGRAFTVASYTEGVAPAPKAPEEQPKAAKYMETKSAVGQTTETKVKAGKGKAGKGKAKAKKAGEEKTAQETPTEIKPAGGKPMEEQAPAPKSGEEPTPGSKTGEEKGAGQ